MRESLVIYRRLRKQPLQTAWLLDRPEHVDYINLGLLYLQLAQRGEGSVAWGSYIRSALCVLTIGRDIALATGRPTEAAHSQLHLAEVGRELALACLEHTRANKGAFAETFRNCCTSLRDLYCRRGTSRHDMRYSR